MKSEITITFLLKDKSEYFYNNIEHMNLNELFYYLIKTACLKFTVNKNNMLSDQIEFNNRIKSGKLFIKKELLKRKGYNLLVLTI
jgi:hypothetical protein